MFEFGSMGREVETNFIEELKKEDNKCYGEEIC